MATRIVGNVGSRPQGPAPAPPAPPGRQPFGPGRTGVLRFEGGRAFVDVGGERIWLDAASVAALRGPVITAKRARREAPDELAPAIAAARRHREQLLAIPGVVAVRAGYRFDGGRITKAPVVVVATDGRPNLGPLPSIDFEVQTTPADAYDLLARDAGTQASEAVRSANLPLPFIDELQQDVDEALEVARTITYRPPSGASLPEVIEAMSVPCHVSPDAGWKVLGPFLSAVRESFVLGMYDFTAPHIYAAARSLLRDSSVTWTMTLGPNESLPGPDETDSTKADDKTEASINRGLKRAGGDRFRTAFAHVGAGRTFASAYHIKVGVRDGEAFWLSSGNFQSSNQPNVDFFSPDVPRREITRYNREWHVVIENRRLSRIFEQYLHGDFETASSEEESARLESGAGGWLPDVLLPESALEAEERSASVALQVFAPKKFRFDAAHPLRVQPVLTPDNYLQIVGDLLRKRPKRTLYFQNQSLNPVQRPTPEFDELMGLLADYSHDPNLDVRIIFRNIGPVRKKLESLQAAGFNMERVRMQSGCHTKGIIIDSRVVLLGSHNFTNDGVQFNRDASLVFYDGGIASYYEDVFLHDWERLARPTVSDETSPRLAGERESAPLGYVRVPWSFYDAE